MAVYNESLDELKLSIESILNQVYSQFEFLIILDNPQNHQVKDFIERYAETDERIKFIINRKNLGLGASLHKAIEFSKTELIARMDADDIALPMRLGTLTEQFKENDDLLFSRYEVIDQFGKHIRYSRHMSYTQSQIRTKLNLNNFICHPSVMFRKSSYLKAGGYSDIRVSEDIDLWIRMAKMKMQMRGIDEVLIKYRIRANSMTTSNYYRTHFAKKFIRNQYKNWNYITKTANTDFYEAFTSSGENVDRYNSDAKAMERAINDSTDLVIKRGLIVMCTAIKHPLLFTILRDRLLSLLIKPKVRSNSSTYR